MPAKPKDFTGIILPPLLKDVSWTKAAPFKESPFHRNTSDSIANNYSPLAAKLNMKLVHLKFDGKIIPAEASNRTIVTKLTVQ